MTPRTELLRTAASLIDGDRNEVYGPPSEDFAKTVGVLNALGYRGPGGRLLAPHDVAVMLAAVKLSRLAESPDHEDSWTDLAGYAACGWECVAEVHL